MPTRAQIQHDLDRQQAERVAAERERNQATLDQVHQQEATARERRAAEGRRVLVEMERRKALTPEQRAAEDDAINQELQAKAKAELARRVKLHEERQARAAMGESYPFEQPGDIVW